MSEIQWSDAEREAAYEASPLLMTRVAKAAVDASIAALAPFVAERERQAAARALREAEAEVERLRATVARVEALAEEYEDLERHEGNGGESWGNTATCLRAALEGDR